MTTTIARGLAPARRELDNGVVVLAKESRATPAVAIHATCEAGAVFDPPGLPGMAYFVSRTIDRGTTTRSADALADEFDNKGVSLAVMSNRHVLSVICNCLTEDVDEMLALVGDIVMNATFPDDQVATRRSEVITTIRQDEDNPASMASERLLELLYPGHPYASRSRGSVEDVERMTAADLRAFHRARFVPSTLSLAIVGDIEPARAIDRAERVFGGWKGPKPPETLLPPGQPASSRQRLVHPMMNKAQADIAYGFVTILRSDPAYYAYSLMNNILGQYSLGGRLGDSIRERQGMAYYVFSGLDANIVRGPLTIRAGVNPSNVDRAVASIDEELTRLAKEGPTDKEEDESKRYLIGSMPRTLETNIGIAQFLQTSEFFDLGLDHDQRLPGLLNQVTRDQIHAAARMLDPSRAAVVIAGPYEDGHS